MEKRFCNHEWKDESESETLEALSQCSTVYNVDGNILIECAVPLGGKNREKLVKVKPAIVDKAGSKEGEKRYWLCICKPGDFPNALNEEAQPRPLTVEGWERVQLHSVFEFGKETQFDMEVECYLLRVDDDELDWVEREVEALLRDTSGTKDLTAFMESCSPEENAKASSMADVILHNIDRVKKTNYWKWNLYRTAANPYN